MATTMAACSGSGSGGGPGGGSDRTANDVSNARIQVSGTSFALTGNPVIDANENGGNFSIDLDIEANGSVDIELSVTKDSNGVFTCGSEATEFVDFDCGVGGECSFNQSLQCNFNNQNVLSCTGHKSVNLTNYFDALPEEASIILCVNKQQGFTTNTDRVEFR